MSHHTSHHNQNDDRATRMTEAERMFSMVGGGLLTLWALRRGGLFASVAALAGGTLLASANQRRWPRLLVEKVRELSSSSDRSSGRQQGGPGSGIRRAVEGAVDSMSGQGDSQPVSMQHSVLIARDKDEVYRFMRDFGNMSRFLDHVQKVDVTDERRSRWTLKGMSGQDGQFETSITEDRPGERLAWKSTDERGIQHEGWATFRKEGSGTRVEACITYKPAGGQVGQAIGKLFGADPASQAEKDLERLKEALESRAAATTAGAGSAATGKRSEAARPV
jgi:uncharacterized membrane protein